VTTRSYGELLAESRAGVKPRRRAGSGDSEVTWRSGIGFGIAAAILAVVAFIPLGRPAEGATGEAILKLIVFLWKPAWLILAGFFGLAAVGSFLPQEKKKSPAKKTTARFGSTEATDSTEQTEAPRPTVAPPSQPSTGAGAMPAKAHPEKTDGDDVDAVREALLKRRRRSGRWKHGLWMLVISALAFFVLGMFHFNVLALLLLALVILLHEAGHWLAMRVFGYRDLRVLFIPLVGGAASGRKSSAPGWQQAVVSLAGPVPGIALGLALLLLAVGERSSVLSTIAVTFIGINGLNLLPVLPLDGGRFFNEILFARSSVTELLFGLLGGLTALAAGIAITSWILMILGGLTLLSTYHLRQISRVAARVKREIGSAASGPDGLPSTDELERIVAIVRSELRFVPENAREMASTVDEVLERVDPRPPRALATVGLLTLYIASIGAAFAPIIVATMMAFGTLSLPERGILAQFAAGIHMGYFRDAALHEAVVRRDLTLIDILITQRIDVDQRNEADQTPLMTAAYQRCERCARRLLAAGADPNATDDYGATPLTYALQEQHTDLVRLLLDVGADVNARNEYGTRPLMTAAYIGPADHVQWLLDAGAEPNRADQSGMTPLHLAMHNEEGSEAIVRALIESGADANAPNLTGHTPLHSAAFRAAPEVVRLLLEAGADTSLECDEGKTALEHALDRPAEDEHRSAVIKLLGGDTP
jgi:Zn-dependent protease